MKRCPYCGKEYADDIFLCPVDQTPLDSPAPAPPSPPPPPSSPPRKSWLNNFAFFIAGVGTCILCEILFVYGAYFFWIKPMGNNLTGQLRAPAFFSPHPATLDFTVFGKDGKPVSLDQYKGRVLVLNIWATWCPPCMGELPDLGKLTAHYAKDTDVAVVCVSEEARNTVFGNASAAAAGATLYATDGARVPAIFQTDVIPATFIIDKNGIIVFQHLGAANWDDASVIHYVDLLRTEQSTNSPSAK